MSDMQIDYQKKYKRTKIINMVLVSVVIGILIGSAFTYGLIGNQGIIEGSKVSADSVKAINTSYTSPVVEVADEVLPSIVMIKNKQQLSSGFMSQSVDSGTGSGIIYKSDGYIITNQHVINGASEIEVILHDGRSFDARILGEDEKTDLAVIKIEGNNFPAAKLGNSDNIKVGQLAVAIGNPMGEEFSGSVTAGIISAMDRTLNMGTNKIKLIQTDAAINPGNSGGALVNKNGEVIGINSIKLSATDVEGMGFSIPINDALPIIEELVENGYIKRPWIGVTIGNVTEALSQRYNVPIGVFISQVDPSGPAAKVGLRTNDIITEIEGDKVETVSELSKIMEEYEPNDNITLKIYRGDKYIDINLQLGVMPSRLS
ncbi:S1C family serine protease [Sporosalibacterium faouarense]|uniref:S1C family serine protease n=1 Tax=Sporosalibacterium faouarense TaxID=516123 RepID=UPI00141D3239|nr:trypsin-like peptidase domain-containing protein [Sporosalibacterium faouarense]MTI47418.1 PDZ domain-containing protein [Bacillota bacterium]